MSGSSELERISFIVSIIVIIGLAILLALLYVLYGFYKKMYVRFGHEDEQIKKDIKSEFEEDVQNKKLTTAEELKEKEETNNGKEEVLPPYQTYKEAYDAKEKKKRVSNIIYNVAFGIFYVVVGVVLVFGIVYKANGEQFFFGDTTVLTIKTGSMESVEDCNGYLYDNGLCGDENRIKQFSLIGIDKVHSEDDLKLYDIVAYKNPKNEIIVHRLINVILDDDGVTKLYTFKGDSNAGCLPYEVNIKFDKVIGKYNGFQNYGLGIVLTYLQSDIGLVALSSALLFLIAYNVSEEFIDKEYTQRKLVLIDELDNMESSLNGIQGLEEHN